MLSEKSKTRKKIRGTHCSQPGLKQLSRTLDELHFPYTAVEQRQEALALASKISIQGVQTKLSAILLPSQNVFQITDTGGKFILKPQSTDDPELPENEGITWDALVDSGAAELALPVEIINRLKLEELGDVRVYTASPFS